MIFLGDVRTLESTTMLPTYHVLLAVAERLAGHHSDGLLRHINLAGSLLLPVVVWMMVQRHEPKEAGRRTVQWFFMPLLFPLYFLIYTDVWALIPMLVMQHLALSRRHLLAAIAGLVATLMRQDMIIWVGLAWLIVVLDGFDFGTWRLTTRAQMRSALLRGLPLFSILVAFAVFYVWNKGVAVGYRHLNPTTFNPTNIAVFLLCAWAVFLPLNLAALPRVWRLLRRPLPLLVGGIGFVLYLALFSNTHQFNGPDLRFYLRNELLVWMTDFRWIRAAAYVPMAWMAATLYVTPLAEPRLRVLLPVALLSAGLHPLIEPRYYLPALTLFQVWRCRGDSVAEHALLAIYVATTTWVMWGIVNDRFFL